MRKKLSIFWQMFVNVFVMLNHGLTSSELKDLERFVVVILLTPVNQWSLMSSLRKILILTQEEDGFSYACKHYSLPDQGNCLRDEKVQLLLFHKRLTPRRLISLATPNLSRE